MGYFRILTYRIHGEITVVQLAQCIFHSTFKTGNKFITKLSIQCIDYQVSLPPLTLIPLPALSSPSALNLLLENKEEKYIRGGGG